MPRFRFTRLSTAATTNSVNMAEVPSSADDSTGRSPRGLAALPGVRTARAISV